MQTADMNRLMDQARVRLPGAVDQGILLELFSTLKEFFSLSNCWREEVTFLGNPDRSPQVYHLFPTQGTPLHLIYLVRGNGMVHQATMPVPGELHLRFTPDPVEYRAAISLTVLDPVTRDGYPQFPAWVLSKYYDTVLDGLLSRMMSQLSKPYSSPQMAALHARRFRQGVSSAKIDANRQNVYGGQAWSYPRGFV